MGRGVEEGSPALLDNAAFHALAAELRALTDAGDPADRDGMLRTITAGHRLAALSEVRRGDTVSMAAPIETAVTPDNSEPCDHVMTGAVRGDIDPHGLAFAADRIALNIHGDTDSHLDALCHVVYNGRLYNDVPAETLTPDGASELSVGAASNGIVGRGVLLDIPRLRGVRWLEPGEHVSYEDLVRAEQSQSVTVGPGDLLFVRVGHRRRRRHLGPWDAAAARAGLHPTAMRFPAERRVAVLGSDGNNDTAPTLVPDVDFPVHVLAINVMGLHLLDYLQFEDLTAACERRGSWAFLCVIAPLRLPGATGSPVNPIAVL